MTCPECGEAKISVLETYSSDDEYVFRRRRCSSCDHRFLTVEMLIPDKKIRYRYSVAYEAKHGK